MNLMTWSGLENYLEKFRRIKAPEDFLKDKISLTIKDILQIEIGLKDIEVRGATIFIKTKNAALKNEIFLNKGKILEKLSKKLGNHAPTDLRF